MDIDGTTATCRACGIIFEAGDQLRRAVPPGLTVTEEGPRVVLTRKVYRPENLPYAVLCAAWLGSLYLWKKAVFGGMQLFWFLWALPILQAVTGIIFLRRVLAKLLNTTTVVIDTEKLVVRHGPFERRELTLPLARIDDFILREGAGKIERHQVLAKSDDGPVYVVAEDIPTWAEAEYLQARLGAALDAARGGQAARVRVGAAHGSDAHRDADADKGLGEGLRDPGHSAAGGRDR
jgi:hypothetical protein